MPVVENALKSMLVKNRVVFGGLRSRGVGDLGMGGEDLRS